MKGNKGMAQFVVPGLIVIAIVMAVISGSTITGWFSGDKGDGETLSVGGDLAGDDDTTSVNDPGVLIINDNVGDAATITFNAFDQQSDSESEVTVPLAAYRGSTKIQDVDSYTSASTLTTASVGDILDVYGGNGTYYVEPMLNYEIGKVTDTQELDAHTIAAESGMEIVVYDKTGSNELAAPSNTSRADYNLSLSSGQEKTIFIEILNNDGDSAYQLCGVCVGMEGNIKEFYPHKDTGFVKSVRPDGLADNVTHWTGSALSSTSEFDNCYVLGDDDNPDVEMLEEYDDVKYKFVIEAKSTDPTSNGGNQAYALFLDCGYAEGSDGKMHFGFYTNDNSEDPASVGLAETEFSPLGKEIGALIDVS